MSFAVVVPRRPDGGRRDELWRYVAGRWAADHPGAPVVEGHHLAGPFNRAAAINAAAGRVPDVDVLVIADSDSFVGVDQLHRAVSAAEITGRFTIAYHRFNYVDRDMSDRILAGDLGDWRPGVEFTMQGTCSNMVAVPRELFDRVGGFDEGFVGWGGEDVAFSLACQTLADVPGLERIEGDLWHLWHPPAPHTHDDVWPTRLDRYAKAAYNRTAMEDLIAELTDEVDYIAGDAAR